ncbi:MAG: hypothetical protein ACRDXX_03470 [Stackebrandtia sp.]
MRETRVDLGALDAFVQALDSEVLSLLDSSAAAVRDKLRPEGEQAFGRSELDSSSAELGAGQQANVEAYLERLTQVRDELGVLREAAVQARQRYREIDEVQAVTARAMAQLLDDLRAMRAKIGET